MPDCDTSNKIQIYHGSDHIIKKPVYGGGKLHNDYGRIFYCAPDIEMAKEWACPSVMNGYANCYELDMEGLTVLNLNGGDYHILNWLAILLENRTFSLKTEIAEAGYQYIKGTFGIPYKKYDVIRGYRADDSFFSFANAFLNNIITVEQLGKTMGLGELGEPIAIVSKRAFERKTDLHGAYLIDVLRDEWRNDDVRLFRELS